MHISWKWQNRFLLNSIMEYFMKQKFRPFHFSLDRAVLMTTSHKFLHAWAVTIVLSTCERCICACSACVLSAMLVYSAVPCGMVKRQSIWGTRFTFLAHKMFDINIGWWWRWNHCLLNLDPYLVSHRMWYRYVILLYSFCINSNYTNVSCRRANMS